MAMKQAVFFILLLCYRLLNAPPHPDAHKLILYVYNNTNKRQQLTFQVVEYKISAELTKQMPIDNQSGFSDEQLRSCDSEIHRHQLNLSASNSRGLLFRTRFNQDAHRVMTIFDRRKQTQQNNNLLADITVLARQYKKITITEAQKEEPRKPPSFFSFLGSMCAPHIKETRPRKHSRAQTE
jgi:hypothetical protein